MKRSSRYQLIFTVFALLSVVVVNAFWKSALVLIILLLLLALIKSRLAPIKHEFYAYVSFFILGPTMESLMMLAGPWSYAIPHLFNFPIWLPFLWGLAGTLGITLYHSYSIK